MDLYQGLGRLESAMLHEEARREAGPYGYGATFPCDMGGAG
jgi:hypothetical protein